MLRWVNGDRNFLKWCFEDLIFYFFSVQSVIACQINSEEVQSSHPLCHFNERPVTPSLSSESFYYRVEPVKLFNSPITVGLLEILSSLSTTVVILILNEFQHVLRFYCLKWQILIVLYVCDVPASKFIFKIYICTMSLSSSLILFNHRFWATLRSTVQTDCCHILNLTDKLFTLHNVFSIVLKNL